ncbi:MAG: NAD-dependent epimerase/dehydratase family protein [Christensenellales bacterium]
METICYLTGAAGYLGRWVAERLVAQGWKVRALVLPGDPLAQHLPQEVIQVPGDLLNLADLERFLEAGEERQRHVIHCAGLISMSLTSVRRVRDINVTGTANLLAVSERLKVSKFIYISSVHALPAKPKGETQRESKVFYPRAMIGAYAQTKAEASLLVMAAAERGLDACLLHPSGLCGPGDEAVGFFTQMFIDYAGGRLPAGVRGGYSFSDVRDVADAVVAALALGQPGEGYIVASHYVTVREIFNLLHEELGGRQIKRMLPVSLASLALPLLSLYYKLARRRPVATRYALFTLSANGDFSNEKARRVLGFCTRPFGESVHDTIVWLRQQGKIRQQVPPT